MARRVFRVQPSPAEQERKFAQTLKIAALVREQALMKECEESLGVFVEESWRVTNPGVAFSHNWHIDAIVEHLEALYRREIRKLIINICPRSLKSGIISVCFPAWVWIQSREKELAKGTGQCGPAEKFMSISYGKSLAMRDSRHTRNLIMSSWYQSRWGSRFALKADQNEKGRFDNDQGGYRIAGSIESGVVGEGASIGIYDDPNNLSEMQFPEYRQKGKDFHSGSFASRAIDPKTDVRLCVQQRSSYGDDMTSYLTELGGWEQLVIPCEYQGRRPATSIGWEDPRITFGDLMHPERLGPTEVASLKVELRENYPGQYNQIPATDGGGSLKAEWFQFYNPVGVVTKTETGADQMVVIHKPDGSTVSKAPKELPPAFEQVVQSWDMAFKDAEENDFVAGHVWGRVGANAYLLARDYDHRSFTDTLKAVKRMSSEYPCPEKLVEDKANGSAVLDTLKNEIPGLVPVNPAGGKWSRVAAISGYVEAGNVWLPNPNLFPWVWDLLKEFSNGRGSKHDDDTDAMTQGLKRLYDSAANQGVPEFRVSPRLGEPQTACHVAGEREIKGLNPAWRRFVSIVPNGSALWCVESPTGALWMTDEEDLGGLDAEEVGRRIAKKSILLQGSSGPQRPNAPKVFELYLPKGAFAELDSGSWAELCEQGIINYVPEEGNWQLREETREHLRGMRFRSDPVEEEDSALDRLRTLLAFAPPDFKEIPYDRKLAFSLASHNLEAYSSYMAQVRGEVRGEWPRLKFSPTCKALIGQMGGFRRDKLDEAPVFVRALLQAVSVPSKAVSQEVKEIPWGPGGPQRASNPRGNLMGRKFSMGRR